MIINMISTDFKADSHGLLYADLTYKIRKAIFNVYNVLGYGHKEQVYQKALEEELNDLNVNFRKKLIYRFIIKIKRLEITTGFYY